MEKPAEYIATAKALGPSKRMGQNFLVNSEIAERESLYGAGKTVLEIGPGLGILTKKLCAVAKKVIAVEKDSSILPIIRSEIKSKNLILINSDFLDMPETSFRECEITISNIPYSISSKVIMFLIRMKMPALLCLQKEFVNHMAASPGSKEYSRLSVITALNFNMNIMMNVSSRNFYPVPKVDSSIIFLKPRTAEINSREIELLSLIMEHKKKKIRNAIHDSREALKISKEKAFEVSEGLKEKDKRPFQMQPHELLETVRALDKLLIY
jgi:16S rRNA (adenine1518-N6/adenine1519-N6)-dimethyltransferase